MSDALLPDSYRVPSRIRWAQRNRFISVVIEGMPDWSVVEGSPVHLMANDGLSLSVVFRGQCSVGNAGGDEDEGNGGDVYAVQLNLFDAVRFGAIEGPTVVDGRYVKLGMVKLCPKEWPRLTKEVPTSVRFGVAYDWDLDGTYEEDEETVSSSSSSEDSEDDDGERTTETGGVQRCDECGEEYLELRKDDASTVQRVERTDLAPNTSCGSGGSKAPSSGPLKPAMQVTMQFMFVAVLACGVAASLLVAW